MIYFVEDDHEIGYVIEKTIEHIGYKGIKFSLGKDFMEAYRNQKPNMVLLDIMLPDMSGLDLLKWIRKDDQKIPIMMISALQSEMDKVIALDLGADDYMTKPFGVLELTSRIQSKMRRFQDEHVITFSSIILNSNKHTCTIHKEPCFLTNKEFDILKLLLSKVNQVVSKESIFEVVWDTDFIGESRALDMHIASLRKKLKDTNSGVEILTIRGIGYQAI